jgi:uroporphyrinogen-III synthase
MATQSRAKTLLLTRPAPQSARFASLLAQNFGPDLRIVIAPLMAPRFLNPALPERAFAALILTSETGAEAARRISAGGQPLPIRAFCVGDQTATAAAAAGFDPISAQGDAAALIHLIRSRNQSGPLLYLHGKDIRGDVADALNSAGIETVSALVYDQIATPLTAEAKAALSQKDPILVPLFSPRSARLFVAEAGSITPLAPLWVAALSPSVAREAAVLSPEKLEIAQHPDAGALIVALDKLLQSGQGS